MKRVDNSLPNGELSGKNTESGEIFVSAKVPKKYREEVAFHESRESHNITRMKHHEKLKRQK
jgi:hypothetical protein